MRCSAGVFDEVEDLLDVVVPDWIDVDDGYVGWPLGVEFVSTEDQTPALAHNRGGPRQG